MHVGSMHFWDTTPPFGDIFPMLHSGEHNITIPITGFKMSLCGEMPILDAEVLFRVANVTSAVFSHCVGTGNPDTMPVDYMIFPIVRDYVATYIALKGFPVRIPHGLGLTDGASNFTIPDTFNMTWCTTLPASFSEDFLSGVCKSAVHAGRCLSDVTYPVGPIVGAVTTKVWDMISCSAVPTMVREAFYDLWGRWVIYNIT